MHKILWKGKEATINIPRDFSECSEDMKILIVTHETLKAVNEIEKELKKEDATKELDVIRSFIREASKKEE